MNLLEDIKYILNNDKEHNIKIEVSSEGITVYLEYDPFLEYHEDCIIPIHYTVYEEFSYIPHDKYCKLYKPWDYGLTSDELKIIYSIMDYLESHKKELETLCKGYCLKDRKVFENNKDE